MIPGPEHIAEHGETGSRWEEGREVQKRTEAAVVSGAAGIEGKEEGSGIGVVLGGVGNHRVAWAYSHHRDTQRHRNTGTSRQHTPHVRRHTCDSKPLSS